MRGGRRAAGGRLEKKEWEPPVSIQNKYLNHRRVGTNQGFGAIFQIQSDGVQA